MKSERIIVLIVLSLFVLPLGAREQDTTHISRNYPSVVVNEDGTVSFCYCGVGRKVYVLSDLYYAHKDNTRYTYRTRHIKMKRQSDGCFHVTTKTVQPETYTYCFRVNGKRKPDPLNNDTAWQRKHKWNVVTVGGSEQSDIYQPPAQQGNLLHIRWHSSAEGHNRRVNIYLPASYGTCTSGLPVLYLIHGINGHEGSWAERGRAIQIMENLVAEGKCNPMILVMPDVNFCVHEDRPSHHTLWNNVFNYPHLCHNHDIEKALVELIQMVDTTYCVGNKRYIAGFSDGARMAANTANQLPNYFSAVGLFSPVVHKEQLPKDNATYYVYTGTKDMFHNNAKRFNRRLTKAQARHEYSETIGGHNWRNWRLHLSDYMVKICQ